MVELSVIGVGYTYIAVVETVVGLTTVIEAIKPGVVELERVFDTMYLVDISLHSFTAPILMIFNIC